MSAKKVAIEITKKVLRKAGIDAAAEWIDKYIPDEIKIIQEMKKQAEEGVKKRREEFDLGGRVSTSSI